MEGRNAPFSRWLHLLERLPGIVTSKRTMSSRPVTPRLLEQTAPRWRSIDSGQSLRAVLNQRKI